MPGRLVELILRGLESDPAARHASMDTLLAALERLLHTGRRRWLVGGAALVGAVALALGLGAAKAVAATPCDQVDDASSMWSAADRDAVGTAIGSKRGPDVVAELDRYAESYGAKRREVCEATRVRGDQSDEALQLRMACLDRMAGRFEGLTSEIADGGTASIVDARAIATRLPSLATCDDVETLAKLTNRNAARSSRSSTEQDEAWTSAVELVERALTRRMLGRNDAREPAERAVDLAAAYDLPGVHSRALSILADLELEAGNRAQAETLRRDAVRLAIADGHDDAAVHLMLDQADAALVDEDIEAAELHLAYFDAFAERMTEPEARADVELRAEIVRGRLDLAHGDAAAAERRLAAIATDDLGDLDRRALWMALGAAQRNLGRDAEAFATWSKLLSLVEQLRGDAHADVAAVLNNLALVRLDDRDHAAAQVLLVRAESIALSALGGDDPLLATIATNRGWAARLAGSPDDARHQLERALRIGRAAYGDRHASLTPALDQLGELERDVGNLEASIERFAESGELRDATLGADHPETAATLLGMGRTFIAMGKIEIARGALDAALRITLAHPGAPQRRAELAMWIAVAAISPITSEAKP